MTASVIKITTLDPVDDKLLRYGSMEDGNHPKRTTTVPAPKRPSVDATAITVTPANRRRVSHVGTNNFVIGFNLDDTFFVLLIPIREEHVPLGFSDDDDESENAARTSSLLKLSLELSPNQPMKMSTSEEMMDGYYEYNECGYGFGLGLSCAVDRRGWEYSEKGSYDGDGRLRQRVHMRLLVPYTFSLVPSETVRVGIGTAGVLIVVDGDVKSYGSGDEGEVDPGESKDSKAPANYTFPFTLDCMSK
ncbi:hypothetical protein JOM56_015481 [Amanita muscaria]